jgi:hypothetical protein
MNTLCRNPTCPMGGGGVENKQFQGRSGLMHEPHLGQVLQLSIAAEDGSPKRLHAIALADDTKLNGVPKHLRRSTTAPCDQLGWLHKPSRLPGWNVCVWGGGGGRQ